MKAPDYDQIAPDALQYQHGGDDENLWTPADWAGAIAECKLEQYDLRDLLQRMSKMQHWQVVEWWMEAYPSIVETTTKEVFEIDADELYLDYCRQTRDSLFAILYSDYKSWTSLRTHLGYTLGKKCELDSRINLDGDVEIKDKVICLTGKMRLPEEHYVGLIVEAGGIWGRDGVSRADYLVAGEWAGMQKLDYAEKKGIAIRGEDALRRALCRSLWLEDAELDKHAPKLAEINPTPKRVFSARTTIDWSQVEWKGICITGKLDKPRKVYHAAIKEAGGQPLENVTSKCELLVVGDDPGSKVEKAKAAGVPICTLDEFKEALAKRGISLP